MANPSTFALLEGGIDLTNATTYNTGSFKPTANRHVLAFVLVRDSDGVAPTPTLTGNSLTWNNFTSVTYDDGTNQQRLAGYVALSSSPTSGAVKISAGDGVVHCAWTIFEVSNTNTTAGATGAILQSNTNSSTNRASPFTVTLGAFGSTLNATIGSFGSVDGPWTQDTGWTAVHSTGGETAETLTEFRSDNDTTVSAAFSGGNTQVGGIALELARSTASTGSTGATPGTATLSADMHLQFRPAAPSITSQSVSSRNVSLTVSLSSEGYPTRWYQKTASGTTYTLDGQTTAGTSTWTFYDLTPLTVHDLGVSHYNTTGHVESVWATTQAQTAGARRVSGRLTRG